MITEISKESKDPTITKEIIAYNSFLQSKERAGIERAVGANTFSKDKFTKGDRTKFNNLIAMQNSYMDTFLSLSSQANLDIYNQKLNIPEVKVISQMRKKALEASHIGGFKIDPINWFEASTKK